MRGYGIMLNHLVTTFAARRLKQPALHCQQSSSLRRKNECIKITLNFGIPLDEVGSVSTQQYLHANQIISDVAPPRHHLP